MGTTCEMQSHNLRSNAVCEWVTTRMTIENMKKEYHDKIKWVIYVLNNVRMTQQMQKTKSIKKNWKSMRNHWSEEVGHKSLLGTPIVERMVVRVENSFESLQISDFGSHGLSLWIHTAPYISRHVDSSFLEVCLEVESNGVVRWGVSWRLVRMVRFGLQYWRVIRIVRFPWSMFDTRLL